VFNVDNNRPYQVITPYDDKEPGQGAGRCCRKYKHSSGASSGVSKCAVPSHLQLLLFTGMSFESWIKDLVYKKFIFVWYVGPDPGGEFSNLIQH